MAFEILQTKLYIPSPQLDAQHVSRPRLLDQLRAGLAWKLTLLSAPAGSGKTTLLSEWIHSSSPSSARFCWLSLDEDDNHVSRFWSYVIAALERLQSGLARDSLAMLQSPQVPTSQTVLTSLLNDLAALPGKVVLILDDYHVISTSAIHEGLAYLLDHQPPQLHLIIATRADPPLPLARLRIRGQLTELRADDLRFTGRETAAFLSDVMGLELESRDISALEARTEGWIAGLRLAALSMQGHKDPHTFVKAFTGSHHYVIEYLVGEVLNRQEQPIQRFLLQTSILDRLCAPLCDTLMGEHDSAQVLQRLHRENLFTIPLDDDRRWYRYHHLFGDLLRKRLGQAVPPEQHSELHRRASQWHEDNGLFEQAVKHAQSAGDFERVAGIAERAAGNSLLDARLTTLLRWVDALPENVLHAHPRLQIYRAWALYMNGHLGAAQKALRDCRRALEALPPSVENDGLRRTLPRLLDTIDMIARGLMYSVDNRVFEAIQVCSRARELALEDGRVFLAVQATEGLALAQYHQGRLRASAQSCQQVIDLATQNAAQAPLAAAGYVELAGIHIEWNDLAAAANLLDQALALCREWGIVQTLNEAYTAQSHLLQIRGDIEGAWDVLEKAREFSSMEGDSSLVNFRLATQQARLNLAAGEPKDAVRWVKETQAAHLRGEQLPAAFTVTLQTTLARACLAQGAAEEALATLEPLLAPAEAAGAFLHVIEVCALKALALQAMGDTAAALAALKRSLSLAEPEGFVRVYLNEGAPMAALLCGASAQGIHTAYASRLLARFTASEQVTASKIPSSAATLPYAQPLTEPLTRRESEVLLLISEGFSNKDIADQLFIALNTVKRHTSSIYGKLGVRSRTQAVARARELDLLPTDQQ